jgi:acetylornithine deacetylase/succinyl-diaminopimelate desuccinylase-like protein
LVRGFYDGIDLDGETKAILAATPQDEEKMMASLQIAVTEKVGDNYQEALQFPSLNVRGMQSGWINESVRTIIPDQARAEIDIRLVKESDPERLISLIRNHIEGLGYFIINKEPTPEERMKYNKLVTITSEISYQSFLFRHLLMP